MTSKSSTLQQLQCMPCSVDFSTVLRKNCLYDASIRKAAAAKKHTAAACKEAHLQFVVMGGHYHLQVAIPVQVSLQKAVVRKHLPSAAAVARNGEKCSCKLPTAQRQQQVLLLLPDTMFTHHQRGGQIL
jgi:hypothetical protein